MPISLTPFYSVLQVQPGKVVTSRGITQTSVSQLTTLLQTSGNATRLLASPATSSMITTSASDSGTTTSSSSGVIYAPVLNGQRQQPKQAVNYPTIQPQLLQTQHQQIKVSQAQAQGVLRGKGQARFLVIKSNKRKYP